MCSTKSLQSNITDIKLFVNCTDAFLGEVLPLLDRVVYLPGDILKTRGSAHQYVWIVQSGGVSVFDDKGTVMCRNDVISMHALMSRDASVCVYTACAAQDGAVCLRLSRDLLNLTLHKYPRDKKVVMYNGFRYALRRPQAHILLAMQTQVATRGNGLTDVSTTSPHSNPLALVQEHKYANSVPNLSKLVAPTTTDMKGTTEVVAVNLPPAPKSVRKDSRKAYFAQDTTYLNPEHIRARFQERYSKSTGNVSMSREMTNARSAPQENRLERASSMMPHEATLHKARRHSGSSTTSRGSSTTNSEIPPRVAILQSTHRHSGSSTQIGEETTLHKTHGFTSGTRFYSNIVSQSVTKGAAEHGSLVEPAYCKIRHRVEPAYYEIRHTVNNTRIRYLCFVFWLAFMLCLVMLLLQRQTGL